MYKYGLIGNCQVSALVGETGSIDWLCLPRPDSEPVFGRLLDPEGGHFTISFAGENSVASQQRYVDNTNVLVTELENLDGARFRITDFCPRFYQFGRIYRPMSIFRIVEPLAGSPTISVSCKPISGWQRQPVRYVRGNSHLRWDLRGDSLRLTTNMPMTYLCEGTPVRLNERLYFGLTWSTAIEEEIAQLSQRVAGQTVDYWRNWVKHCSIPSLFQREVIRSALTLKLHCYEDTGAILAALTTSLPEEIGGERNWDYRYCWLRDAYFVLSAFHNLGHYEEMEAFLKFLLSIAHHRDDERTRLSPVYTLSTGLPLPETIHDNWRGFESTAPVRSHNQAAEHVQNDVYGEMVLTLAPIFLDERFRHLRGPEHEALLIHLGHLCAKTISQPDAGLWEVRDGWQEHTFSNLMSWAGLERIERIHRLGYLRGMQLNVSAEKVRAEQAVRRAVKDSVLRNGPVDDSLDSALALLPILRFPFPEVPYNTIREIQKVLAVESGADASFYYRYIRRDDFGRPHSAFVICSFWIAQGLAHLGRKDESVQMLNRVLEAANPLGLYSEHYLPQKRQQLGNFPQAYSHVGLINAAFAASPPWSEVL
ncbi:MAG: glycoside hydrolase family 15 protein [Bdellovibrionales bacterium]